MCRDNGKLSIVQFYVVQWYDARMIEEIHRSLSQDSKRRQTSKTTRNVVCLSNGEFSQLTYRLHAHRLDRLTKLKT